MYTIFEKIMSIQNIFSAERKNTKQNQIKIPKIIVKQGKKDQMIYALTEQL